jgi:hypothetical protein
MRRQKDRTFLLQTKDPQILYNFAFPDNVVLGITLETNRDEISQAISKAPPPSQRYAVFRDLVFKHKMVTVEPVLDVDLDVMIRWIEEINPCMIWLGYDSRNTGLREPESAKVRDLHWELGKRGFVVILKTIREANHLVAAVGTTQSATSEADDVVSSASESADWDIEAISQWARNATPSSRLAMWLLSQGRAMAVADLNKAAVNAGFPDAKGAIIGGINAVSKRLRRKHVVERRDSQGKTSFAMRSELRSIFHDILSTYDEAQLVQGTSVNPILARVDQHSGG